MLNKLLAFIDKKLNQIQLDIINVIEICIFKKVL